MKRINLVTCVRVALEVRGISTRQVVEAVNAALGELDKVKSSSKLGVGNVQLKRGTYSVTESLSNQFKGALTVPLHFDAWHCKIEVACKVAEIPEIKLPVEFDGWLNKMMVKETPAEVVTAEVPAT